MLEAHCMHLSFHLEATRVSLSHAQDLGRLRGNCQLCWDFCNVSIGQKFIYRWPTHLLSV